MNLTGVQAWSSSGTAHLATLVVSVISGLVPFINIEAYLVAVAALTPAAAWPVILITTLGQMLAKVILYQAGRSGRRPLTGRFPGKLERAEAALSRHPAGPDVVILVSALTGLPPFFGVSVAAGLLHVSLTRFLLIATPARLVRFALVFFAPRWIQGLM